MNNRSRASLYRLNDGVYCLNDRLYSVDEAGKQKDEDPIELNDGSFAFYGRSNLQVTRFKDKMMAYLFFEPERVQSASKNLLHHHVFLFVDQKIIL